MRSVIGRAQALELCRRGGASGGPSVLPRSRFRAGAIYRLRGTPAAFLGIVYAPDERAALAKATVVSAAVEVLEDREAVGVAYDRLAVDGGGAVRRIVAPPGEQADPSVLLPRDQAVSVVFDLVDPLRPREEACRPELGCRAR